MILRHNRLRPANYLFGIFFKCFLTLKRVPFKLRYCSIFKVLCAAPSRVGSSFIISHPAPFVKHFFEIFLSGLFSAVPPRRVPDYITTPPPECQHLFHVFSSFLRRAVPRRFLPRWPGLPGRLYTYYIGKSSPAVCPLIAALRRVSSNRPGSRYNLPDRLAIVKDPRHTFHAPIGALLFPRNPQPGSECTFCDFGAEERRCL